MVPFAKTLPEVLLHVIDRMPLASVAVGSYVTTAPDVPVGMAPIEVLHEITLQPDTIRSRKVMVCIQQAYGANWSRACRPNVHVLVCKNEIK